MGSLANLNLEKRLAEAVLPSGRRVLPPGAGLSKHREGFGGWILTVE